MMFQGKAPSYALTALVGASVLAATVACGTVANQNPIGPEYLGVCVDPNTGMRVPDENCGGVSPLGAALTTAFLWDYIDTYRYPNWYAPAYGSRVNITNITVVHNVPAGASSSRSVPRTGGSASSVRSGLAKSGNYTKAGSSGGSGSKSSPGISRGGFGVPSGRSGGTGGSSGGSRGGSSAGS